MKLLIALYFYILATIQLGLFLGIYHYYRSQNAVKPSPYWMSSLLVSILAMGTFGAGIVTLNDAARPDFNFTVANTLFYIAAILQLLFCRSLTQPISRALKIAFVFSVIIFLPIFEFMRTNATFELRTAFMCLIIGSFFVFQITQLSKKRKSSPSRQLEYLQYATIAELFCAAGRLGILVISELTIHQVEQIPQILILVTVAQMVMNTLSYIAISGYWSEKIAIANAHSEFENERIRQLLLEREGLIASLLRANKTAATGALSASIAHELNQPLGASALNIQFLQKKLLDGGINSTLANEVLEKLLSDNERTANIIKSLRSIFTESKLHHESVNIRELIDSILQISNPEIQSKNIQIVLKHGDNPVVSANRGELQQVVLNLLNNAMRALNNSSQQEKRIVIETRTVSDGFELSIADNGGGISPQVRSHLFELLHPNKGADAGMGLGLWLCQHILTRHGGRIGYEDAPDGGALFKVFLPAESPDHF